MTFSEWALANPAAYAYRALIPVENSGWALFITSRGRNHAKSMLKYGARELGLVRAGSDCRQHGRDLA
ncbi:hypothetical protein BEL01nite_38380 [Bradyrhizobium elkanii]|nr:hypothetical protein BEL01nite_38380 [Bradyrhizobium elkanii]